jgi:hypothetical protein
LQPIGLPLSERFELKLSNLFDGPNIEEHYVSHVQDDLVSTFETQLDVVPDYSPAMSSLMNGNEWDLLLSMP